jgi:hypothetical protein
MRTLLLVAVVLIGAPVLLVLLRHLIGKVRAQISAAAVLGKKIRGTTDVVTRLALFNELLEMSGQEALNEIAWLGLSDTDQHIRGLPRDKLLAAGPLALFTSPWGARFTRARDGVPSLGSPWERSSRTVP